MSDLSISNQGSIFLFRPNTEAGREWLGEHCPPDGEHQYFGKALVVEHRYAGDLANYAVNDGLTVS